MGTQNSKGLSPRTGSDVCRALLAIPDAVRVALAIQAHAELIVDLADLAEADAGRVDLAPLQARFMALDSVYRGADVRDTARLTKWDAIAITGTVMARVAANRARLLAHRLPASTARRALLEELEAESEYVDIDTLVELASQLVAS